MLRLRRTHLNRGGPWNAFHQADMMWANMRRRFPINGTYRITHMIQGARLFPVAENPAHIGFGSAEREEFQFGCVCGRMDCEYGRRDGRPAIEWTFEGNDESGAITGRGWVVLQDDGTLHGKLFIHHGDSSEFTAEKMRPGKHKPKAGK